MNELFETVLILSLLGFGITALLLLLKPVAIKKFPAKWQYYMWIAVLFSMIIPVYKFIPEREAERLSYITGMEATQKASLQKQEVIITENPKISVISIPDMGEYNRELADIFAYIWIGGVFIYTVVVAVCYTLYLFKIRKSSFFIADNSAFEEAKKELGICSRIRLKMSECIRTPMLVGVIFPTVYIPAKNISDENMRMVFLHELTHYRRKDLIVKWLSLFVNAVHWFNPLAYLLCANISEACELSCDMAVTHNMSDNEQKNYMKTILDLVE